MSVQLIVYPQTYDGESNPLATITEEFVVDGIDFNTINASSSYDGSGVVGFVGSVILAAAPPVIVNTWYRWRYPAAGTQPDLPIAVSEDLVLEAGDSPNLLQSGVYQRLSNLLIGQTYVVTVKTETPSAVEGILVIEIYDGTSQGAYVDASITGADITLTFTATATDNILFLSYNANVSLAATEDTITNVSIVGQGIVPSGIQQHLGDGQVICDLYEDEDIPLTLSVDDFKNVAEQVQSYSKAFKLPATKRNNKIFESLFEITRSAQNTLAFNPYVKTQCVLKQDGFILFEGYLKMIDIQDQEGEISYNLNLYSEVVALADVLGDRTFSELDFTELKHDYNRTQIKRSWNDLGGGTGLTYTNAGTSGYRTSHNTVKYPFVDWAHQIGVGGSGGSSDAIAGCPELPSLGAAFRPFINVRYCIDRIFEDTPFSFTSEFFDTDEFKDLFMDFNWGADEEPNVNQGQGTGTNDDSPKNAGLSWTILEFDDEDFSSSTELGFDISASTFTANRDNQLYYVQCNFIIGYQDFTGSGPYVWIAWQKSTGAFSGLDTLFASAAGFGSTQYSKTFAVFLNSGESIRPVFYKTQASSTVYQATVQQVPFGASLTTTVMTGTSDMTTEVLLQNLWFSSMTRNKVLINLIETTLS